MDSMGMEQEELQAILEEFYTEAEEGLDNMEQDLIRLEALSTSGDTDTDTVDRLFRSLHTLKGGAGFLGLERIAKLAHAGENLLDEVRGGKVAITKRVMDALLQTNDFLKELLSLYQNQDDVSQVDTTALVRELEHLATAGAVQDLPREAVTPVEKAEAEAVRPAAPPPPAADPVVEINAELLAEVMADDSLDPSRDTGEDGAPAAKPAADPVVEINAELLAEVMADDSLDPSRDTGEDGAPAAKPAADPVVEINAELLAEVMADDSLDPSRDTGDDGAPAAKPATPAAEVVIARENVEPMERRERTDRRDGKPDRRELPRRQGDARETTIRVETARLDEVMNLVGELVLARNSLVRQLRKPESVTILENLDNAALIFGNMDMLSRVTQDLQMSVLRTRMQPVKKVFDKIPRQVRELKTKLAKEVDLIIEGEMTEVDKSLVEELSDPMVHLIRNALDHGIEKPADRVEMGKNPEAKLWVRAFYEGNNVVIQIAEDGKGIDPIFIKRKAVEKGLIDQETADTMTDREAVRLIMLPGFSTAQAISDVSGRGVGMDVVNDKIQALKGSINIDSRMGEGTTFSIYLPLTLAIIQALVVEAAAEGFAIPISTITEVLKFDPKAVHEVNGQEVVELRGEVLPLFYLGRLARGTAETAARRLPPLVGKSRNIIVVRDGGLSMGLIVDDLLGQEEAVVKPLTSMFDYHPAISGATITGDGHVHMILDVAFLMRDLYRAQGGKSVA
jgi:two-component system chemotaxis sensor kinase CheA